MGTRQTPGSVGLAQRGDGLGGKFAGVEGAVMVKQVDSETITEVLRIRHAVDSVGAPAHIDEGETHPWVALLQGFAHQDVIDSVWMHYTRESPRGVADGCNCFGTLARANAAFPPTPTAHTPRPPPTRRDLDLHIPSSPARCRFLLRCVLRDSATVSLEYTHPYSRGRRAITCV